MFHMRELPSRSLIDSIATLYSELDPSAVVTCDFLLRTGSDLLSAFETNLARYNMSQSRFIVLLLLQRIQLHEEDAGINPSRLAEQAGVSRATMTGLLDGLEREGLIARQQLNGDRRMFSIRMTQKGQEVLETIFPDYYTRIAELMHNLTEEERDVLVSLLKKVNEGIPSFQKP